MVLLSNSCRGVSRFFSRRSWSPSPALPPQRQHGGAHVPESRSSWSFPTQPGGRGPGHPGTRDGATSNGSCWASPSPHREQAGGHGHDRGGERRQECTDGYTVLFGAASEMAINASLFKNMTYDPRTDLEPASSSSPTFPLVFIPPTSQQPVAEEIDRGCTRQTQFGQLRLDRQRQPATSGRRAPVEHGQGQVPAHSLQGLGPAGSGCGGRPCRHGREQRAAGGAAGQGGQAARARGDVFGVVGGAARRADDGGAGLRRLRVQHLGRRRRAEGHAERRRRPLRDGMVTALGASEVQATLRNQGAVPAGTTAEQFRRFVRDEVAKATA